MLATFQIERRIDVIRDQVHLVVAPGRFQTSSPEAIKILRGYPGATLISSEPEPTTRPLTPQEALALHGCAPEPVRVSNGGVQMKPRKGD
jgi:hypothetical protein